MTLLQEIQNHKSEILAFGNKHGCRNIRVFGSVIRGEETAESDIDFLVNIDSDRSLLDFVGFKQDLEELFNKNIDLVTEKGLHWFIRNDVLREALPL